MGVRIYLTARVAMEVEGEVVLDERQFRGRQGRVAFAYLAFERARPVTRDELVAVLWPEDPPPVLDVALSAVISRIRRLLAADPLRARGVYLSGGLGQYQLLLPADTWVDVEAGASAIDVAEAATRVGESARVLGPAAVAAAIARRPFLPGVEGEWVDSQRRRLERQLLRALDCLARMWLATGEPGLAVENATEAISADPFRESSHLSLRAHVASGNPAQAVQVYRRLQQVLDQELGTRPSTAIEAFYQELVNQR